MTQTNYERYFGTPVKAADSISRLVDHYDVLFQTGGEGEQYRSEFTDHFRFGGDCEFGLIHQDTLADWLVADWDKWVLEKKSQCPSDLSETLRSGDNQDSGDLLHKDISEGSNGSQNVQEKKPSIETFKAFVSSAEFQAKVRFKDDYNRAMALEALNAAKYYIEKCKEVKSDNTAKL